MKQERTEALMELVFPLVQQLAVKIAQAAECRDFTRARQEEEDSRAAQKKRKQITWGSVTLCLFMSILFVWQLSNLSPFPHTTGGANPFSVNFKLCKLITSIISLFPDVKLLSKLCVPFLRSLYASSHLVSKPIVSAI